MKVRTIRPQHLTEHSRKIFLVGRAVRPKALGLTAAEIAWAVSANRLGMTILRGLRTEDVTPQRQGPGSSRPSQRVPLLQGCVREEKGSRKRYPCPKVPPTAMAMGITHTEVQNRGLETPVRTVAGVAWVNAQQGSPGRGLVSAATVFLPCHPDGG